MASTSSGTLLTEQERAAQLALRASAAREFAETVWPLLDPVRLDETAPVFVRQAAALVLDYRARSTRSAVHYVQAFRAAETGDARAAAPTVATAPSEALRRSVATSLAVTGPVSVKQRTARGTSTQLAARHGLVDATGAVTRHVLDGGRGAVVNTVRGDSQAIGFVRVTDADPCAFCAMLATRAFGKNGRVQGVYRSRASAQMTRSRESYHDHCGCSVEPVFRGGAAALPRRSAHLNELWSESTRGLYGNDAMRAFARALADQRRNS